MANLAASGASTEGSGQLRVLVVDDEAVIRGPLGLCVETLGHRVFEAGSVEEALNEGLRCGGASVLDHLLLADVHPQLYAAMLGQRKIGGHGALAIIETGTVASNVRAAELALKGTPVDLVEIRLADTGLSGKGVSIYQGELPDVEAAVDIAVTFLRHAGAEVRYKVISAPHEALIHQIEASTYFGSATLQELEGEIG